ncbi:kinetochore protein Spc25-like [Patiria miniata]|uniref:Kinetochore protein SPC25 n=1 Tax=Patiria miniata TaxID=46514 RepID=A0A913YZ22_PATMI|nr:kinetochore protein Spc25-like [Patiria miniata]XP_038044652.1 kinetochore protein Spc25-like [Patiria miniata]
MMATANQACPGIGEPSELDTLTGNLLQAQDTFLNRFAGDQLQQFLQQHWREHQATIQQGRDKIASLQKDLQSLEQQELSNKQVEEVNRKRLREVREQIKQESARCQELLFEKEQKEKELQAETEKYNQQKELVEAQEKATKARLRELNKAGGLYQDRLGLQFKNIGDGQLQFAFTQLDPKDHNRVFFFTIKIENNKYNLKDCNPNIEGLEKMVDELNESNNLMKFVVATRRKFKEFV